MTLSQPVWAKESPLVDVSTDDLARELSRRMGTGDLPSARMVSELARLLGRVIEGWRSQALARRTQAAVAGWLTPPATPEIKNN